MNNTDNEIYEYGLIDLLSIAVEIFSKNIINIILLVATISLPTFILGEFISLDGLLENNSYFTITDYEEFLIGIIQGTAMLIADFGIIYLAFNTLERKESDYNTLINKGLSSFLPMFKTNLLMVLCILGLLILLLIPGIIFGVFWVFTLPIVVHKNKTGWDALNESKRLVEGRWLMVFFYSIIIGLIVGISTTIIDGFLTGLSLFSDSITGMLFSGLTNLIYYLVGAYSLIFFAVFYYNLNQFEEYLIQE